MRPSWDPDNPSYKTDPGYQWCSGQWRTPEGVARLRDAHRRYRQSPKGRAGKAERNRENNPRRLIVGGTYLGMVGFTEAEREVLLRGASQ